MTTNANLPIIKKSKYRVYFVVKDKHHHWLLTLDGAKTASNKASAFWEKVWCCVYKVQL